MGFLKAAATVIVGIYLGVCAIMFLMQRSLQYVPETTLADPAAHRLDGVALERLRTADGETLVTWWRPPADGRPVFLYLHGNGRHLGVRAERFARLMADGSGLLAVSWRGYGGSTGSPTEPGLIADARAAYAELRRRVAADRIVVFGESLGTTVAVKLAAEEPVAALVLDSSFTSTVDVAAQVYPWLPVRLLMLDQFRADLAAPRVTVPVFQAHCRADHLTPLPLAERIATLFPRPPERVVIEGHCHVTSILRYEAPMRAFLDRVLARPVAAAPRAT